ncbi:hypothetical protein CXB77_00735 [Chromatium okenii]|uniref:Prepilin-type cleavage/methylation domain-containing protein n=2 Tax=Chromatium okenii TaxID=61644 RepID=A0A2S7XV31_9GAMM|nr:hypothetical protein CXB77_00735 [Chromatium okenii]
MCRIYPLGINRHSHRFILRQRMTGTTLLELMITLSIAAILMSIAVPSFQPSRAPIASLRSPINSAVHCNSHVRKQ